MHSVRYPPYNTADVLQNQSNQPSSPGLWKDIYLLSGGETSFHGGPKLADHFEPSEALLSDDSIQPSVSSFVGQSTQYPPNQPNNHDNIENGEPYIDETRVDHLVAPQETFHNLLRKHLNEKYNFYYDYADALFRVGNTYGFSSPEEMALSYYMNDCVLLLGRFPVSGLCSEENSTQIASIPQANDPPNTDDVSHSSSSVPQASDSPNTDANHSSGLDSGPSAHASSKPRRISNRTYLRMREGHRAGSRVVELTFSRTKEPQVVIKKKAEWELIKPINGFYYVSMKKIIDSTQKLEQFNPRKYRTVVQIGSKGEKLHLYCEKKADFNIIEIDHDGNFVDVTKANLNTYESNASTNSIKLLSP